MSPIIKNQKHFDSDWPYLCALVAARRHYNSLSYDEALSLSEIEIFASTYRGHLYEVEANVLERKEDYVQISIGIAHERTGWPCGSGFDDMVIVRRDVEREVEAVETTYYRFAVVTEEDTVETYRVGTRFLLDCFYANTAGPYTLVVSWDAEIVDPGEYEWLVSGKEEAESLIAHLISQKHYIPYTNGLWLRAAEEELEICLCRSRDLHASSNHLKKLAPFYETLQLGGFTTFVSERLGGPGEFRTISPEELHGEV